MQLKFLKENPGSIWGRIAVVAIMSGSALALRVLGALPLSFPIVLAEFLVYLFFTVALKILYSRKPHWFWDYGQMILDVGWISFFVYTAGGSEHPFTLLFFLAIILAANVRFARGAIFTATLSSLALGVILYVDYRTLKTGLAPSGAGELISAFNTDFLFRGYLYAICFYLVAGFSGYLAERLRLKGRQLEDTTRALEEFKLSTGDILEKIGSGLLTLSDRGQIMYCNLAGSQILGLDIKTIIGRNIAEIAQDGLTGLALILDPARALNGDKSQRMEIKISRGRAEDIPLGVTTTSICDAEGKLEGIIAIFQDLSAIKSMENRMIEVEQLETSKELTKNLLKTLHPYISDINSAIYGLMKNSEINDEAKEMAIRIKEKTEYIRKTIDNFIRFAHVEMPQEEKAEAESSGIDSKIIGRSRNFIDIMNMAQQVAPTDSTVLILGESGTGKELLAKELHRLSNRNKGPFVSINCAALPETLLESELFGHVRGSFTGAVRDKEGLFRVASDGTFFLDEVAETSPGIQVKLLRVLQEREIVPVGGTKPIKVNVRMISATNMDLAKAVESNKFRMDLYYRLNVIQMTIPPLRERGDDILLLADHIIKSYCQKQNLPPKLLSQSAKDGLMNYGWPGNIRELENVLERAIILESGAVIELSGLPEEVTRKDRDIVVHKTTDPATITGNLKEEERQTILRVLSECGNNKALAAKKLGIHYATLVS